jgi:CcdB protein
MVFSLTAVGLFNSAICRLQEQESTHKMTPQLAGVSRTNLGPPIGNIAEQRAAIVAAFDKLIAGV